MGSINSLVLVGNLGREPEKRTTRTDSTMAVLRVATSRQWTDKESGEKKDQTQWHRVIAWGNLAELALKYLSKGRQVGIEGEVRYRKYEDENQHERWITEIYANRIHFLGRRPDAPASEPSTASSDPDDIPF